MPLQDGGREWDCPRCGKDLLFDCRCGIYRAPSSTSIFVRRLPMTPSAPTAALKPIEGLVGPKDLRVETYREYVFLPNGETYRVDNPVALYFREGGTTHRIVDAAGVVHCVPYGAGQPVVLRWENKDKSNPVGF